MFTQGWSAVTTLGPSHNKKQTLKGFAARETPSGLFGFFNVYPGFSLRSNPGLGLTNAFGVFKLTRAHKYDSHQSFRRAFTPANHLHNGYSNNTPAIHER
jgi:hypothetical protein